MTDYEQFLEENGLTEEDCERAKDGVEFIPFSAFERRGLRIAPSSIAGQGVFSISGLPSLIDWPPAQTDGMWTEAGRYMNHSPTPNCDVVHGPNGLNFATKRQIAPGEELTCNYRDMKRAIKTINRRDCVSSAA